MCPRYRRATPPLVMSALFSRNWATVWRSPWSASVGHSLSQTSPPPSDPWFLHASTAVVRPLVAATLQPLGVTASRLSVVISHLYATSSVVVSLPHSTPSCSTPHHTCSHLVERMYLRQWSRRICCATLTAFFIRNAQLEQPDAYFGHYRPSLQALITQWSNWLPPRSVYFYTCRRHTICGEDHTSPQETPFTPYQSSSSTFSASASLVLA